MTARSDEARAQLADALTRTGREDRAAFRLLYRLTAAKLFGVALRICGERQGAEDVLQETYWSVWRRAGSFDPARGSAIAWLAAIARNRAIDWRRRRHLPPVNTGAELVADPQEGAESAMLLAEREQLLRDCLEALDARPRELIRTAFFGGWTYAELAAREAVPLGTAKSWIRRGLLQLRECLGDG